jgi:acetoin utilization deacetylase AcuC-like enzyme/acyl-CoA hydrolase
MAIESWQSIYAQKLVSAKEALGRIRSGQTVFVSSGAAEPVLLTDTLAEMALMFTDVEIIHLSDVRENAPLCDPKLANNFHQNHFYHGRGVSEVTIDGESDFTPMNVAQLPGAIANGTVPIDVALIHVSPPDAYGLCSLGVSVDAGRAAVKHASLIIAQVNDRMPETMGDSLIPVDNIHFLVEYSAELCEVPPVDLDPVSLTIGRHVASLISDGMTLHVDGGPIGAATLRYLDLNKDLGIHTDVLTDDILRLIRSGAITNRKKQANKGKTVATMAIGSKELYDSLNRSPYVELYPVDEVNDPAVIAQNDNVACIHLVRSIELTGLARVGDDVVSQMRSLPSGMDFADGAQRSKNGINIFALPSTSADGLQSRIVALSISRGAAFLRTRIEYVVTEYGVVNLFGLSIRERAMALISIAHPKFRVQLLEEAKRFHYVGQNHKIAPEEGCIYPKHYEFTHVLKDGTEIFFRPVRPGDARRLQRLFYSLSAEAIRLRYHGTKKSLSYGEAQALATVDYSQDMAIVGLVGPRNNPVVCGEGRYTYDPSNRMGEFDIVVHRDYRGHGIALLLANYLNKIAYANGLAGVYAMVIQQNSATKALLDKAWPTALRTFDSGTSIFTVKFPEEDVTRPKDSIVIYSGRFGDFSYGRDHPFDPSRARVVLGTIDDAGYLNEPWIRTEEPRMITKERLVQTHSPEFVDALHKANEGEWQDEFIQLNLGTDDCPIFKGIFDYVLLYASATATGVDLIMRENANVVFNPLGGFHHSSRTFAEGFCYVNDIILAIDMFLAGGYRVACVDIDAHHGNGVQDAYYRDDRVLVVSTHQTGKALYPGTGFEDEIGEDMGEGFTVNVPLPTGSDDEIFLRAIDRVVTPAVEKFAPTAVIAIIGTDGHRSDPGSGLNFTNNGMSDAMERIRDYSNHLLLLAGGGYDLRSTTRGWTRMWGAANRMDALPDYLLVMGGAFVSSADLQGGDLVDMTYRVSGKEKEEMVAEIDRIVAFHEANTLPIIGRRSDQEE